MANDFLVKIFEHNNWANLQIVQACSTLSDDQLDAEPRSATKGTIRSTLIHLINSQRGYLALLTLPVNERPRTPVAFSELEESVRTSGEGLVALVSNNLGTLPNRLQTTDGYHVAPWVVLLQVINHATEHREQIKSMLSALGVTSPSIDGWDYGEETNTLVAISK